MFTEISKQVEALVTTLNTVEELEALDKQISAIGRPARLKVIAIKKAEREAKRAEREGEAERLCLALRPGEKVKMCEHGFLDIFSSGGGNSRFYQADATVHCYQPRKKILWLNVKVRRGHAKGLTDECRPFRLHEVASNNVRRAVL
jgi:hypothetical protein